MIICDVLLKGGSYVTMDESFRILEDHDMAIKDGKILDICPAGSKEYHAAEELEAEGCLITPGFINAHTHMPMTYFRGLADDLPLDRWLQEYIWPLEAKMISPEFVYDASLHAASEMLTHGITLANDMYFYLDQIAQASLKAGMRVIVSEAIIGHTFKGSVADIGSKVRSFQEKYRANAMVDCALAPHAIYTCGKEILQACAEAAAKNDWLIHMHLSETKSERENCLKEHGLLPLQYLHSLGFTAERCIFAHGVWLSVEELDLIADSSCGIAVCTDSNLKLSSGFLPLKAIKERGIKAVMATDGVASNNNLDILEELGTTAKLHKAIAQDPEFLPAREAFAMLTIDAAKALGKDDHLGSLELGKDADICIIDMDFLHSQPIYNPYSHLVYAVSSGQIRDVLVAGKFSLRDHQLQNVDTDAMVDKAKYWKNKILSEIGK
jgi:5-methylthioadenosine/S-adenosylhomocysteine deaminase